MVDKASILACEQNNLNATIELVKRQLSLLKTEEEEIDSSIKMLLKHYNSDNVDMFDQLVVGTDLQKSIKTRLKNHVNALSKPYFARIDFSDAAANGKVLPYYIGKFSIIRDDTLESVVIDWRAPVASLYYEGVLGSTGYDCPTGHIPVELSLKRQFDISNAELCDFYDVDLVANDELLQKVLGTSTEDRLKEVVSTIQKEQNAIIRRTPWRSMVIQGVAGSGKTTVALHRIAYLVFNYENKLKPEHFLILGPNKFFLNYISNVLPDLGVDEVRQFTYEELYGNLLKRNTPINDLLWLSEENQEGDSDIRLIMDIVHLKGSIAFRDILNTLLYEFEHSFIQNDIVIDDILIFKKEELCELFESYTTLPLSQRFSELNKHIKGKINAVSGKLLSAAADEISTQVASEMRDQPFEKRCQNYLKAAVKKGSLSFPTVNIEKLYYGFLQSDRFKELTIGRLETAAITLISNMAKNCSRKKRVDKADIAAIMYLQHYIYGIIDAKDIRHIIIDEAQDLNVFALYTIKTIARNSFFTILGDINQGIFDYEGINDWNELENSVFESTQYDSFSLEKSYRSTCEIMACANHILNILNGGICPAQSVERHGRAVHSYQCVSGFEAIDILNVEIAGALSRGMKTIAIICNSKKDCNFIYNNLSHDVNGVSLIDGDEKEYRGGISVIPIYLAKGMEFDTVLLYDINAIYKNGERHSLKLLYVALTRALNELTLIYKGKPLIEFTDIVD